MTSLWFQEKNYESYGGNGKLKILVFMISTLIISILPLYQIALAVTEHTPSNAASIATSVTQNLLTVVVLLLGTSSFILGLSIQNSSRLTDTMNKYFRILILAMVLPSVVINLWHCHSWLHN
jgi:hypothetical protein